MELFLYTVGVLSLIWIIYLWYIREFIKLAHTVNSNRLHTWRGFGKLVTRKDPDWSRHRKVLNKAFSPSILKSFFNLFHREINNVIEDIEKSKEKGDDVDLLVIFRAFTMRIASKTTLKRNLEQTEFNSFIMAKHAHALLEFVADTCISQIMAIEWICKLAEKYLYTTARDGLEMFRRLVRESVDIIRRNDTKDPSYLPEINSVLDFAFMGVQQNILRMDEINSQMTHIYFGAFESTSTTLFLVIALLAMHPHYQERAYEEVSSLLPPNDNEITLELMEQATYIDMIFKETMRLFPAIPMVFRKVTKEDLILSNGVKLPVGLMICIDLYTLHRSKHLYGPNANAFNPDNFLPANVAERHPFAYIPFTKGQRSCIEGLLYSYNYANKYGPNCVMWLGILPVFLSTDPEVLKDIFTSKNCIDNLRSPPIVYKGITTIAGEGLISQNDPDWSRHRKVLNKAFSPTILKSFFNLFHREINNVIEDIEKSKEKGDGVDMLVIFRASTMRIASKTTLKRNLEQTEFNSFIMAKHAHALLEFIADACSSPIMTIEWICKLAEKYLYTTARDGLDMFRRLVRESVDIIRRNDTKDPSYLPEINSVLDFASMGVQQNILRMDEIDSQMMHIYFGAFESTSTTLFLVIALLAMHPHYQERAYEEVSSLLPPNDNEITLELMEQATYVDMIFKETMRLFPAIPMVFRKVTKEDLILSNGVKLPVGLMICIDLYTLHRSKHLYGPNANAFNPDNFLPANVAERHPFAYIPFTKGQRSCIGMRYAETFFKISLAKLIKTYKFTTDFKYEDLICENHMSLKIVEEPRVHLERRE
ncbi:putative cytochrome P450 313a4 [Lucilia cuprina]|nr:putative cytochrome P450 313a4 [Lucilia cuprina]